MATESAVSSRSPARRLHHADGDADQVAQHQRDAHQPDRGRPRLRQHRRAPAARSRCWCPSRPGRSGRATTTYCSATRAVESERPDAGPRPARPMRPGPRAAGPDRRARAGAGRTSASRRPSTTPRPLSARRASESMACNLRRSRAGASGSGRGRRRSDTFARAVIVSACRSSCCVALWPAASRPRRAAGPPCSSPPAPISRASTRSHPASARAAGAALRAAHDPRTLRQRRSCPSPTWRAPGSGRRIGGR